MQKIKKKILYINILFFLCIFFIITIFNKFYQEALVKPKFKLPHQYVIKAEQFYEYKSNALDTIMKKFFVTQKNIDDRIYKLRGTTEKQSSIFLKNSKSILHSELLTKNFIDANAIQSKVNEIYSNEINLLINVFKKNSPLFKDLEYSPEKFISLKTSNFFQDYPPPVICHGNSEDCYLQFTYYYLTNLFKLEQEKKLTFNIKYIKDKNIDVVKKGWSQDLPINLGFSIILSYIFFLWSSRFAKKRRR